MPNNPDADFAVKVIDQAVIKDKFKELIVNEIELMSEIQHPNVCRLYTATKTPSNYYLVMEFCNGGDLQDFVSLRGGFLNEPIARGILKQMVYGLAAMADKKVIHRDFKLANILINFPTLRRIDYMAPDFNLKDFLKTVKVEGCEGVTASTLTAMEIKIADMGFAKKLEENQLAQTSLGTPLNMAPEVLFHRKYDTKADVWSLGCVFYEMLTGFTPFTGVSKQNLA